MTNLNSSEMSELGMRTSVGHASPILMEYIIGIGPLGGVIEEVLAFTESFREGISLSDLKWGFYNASDNGNSDSAFIEFTLHDIAGRTFEKFLKIKTTAQLIYFMGPTSSGNLWPGEWTVYQPNQDSCNLEFSPTQGFTYKFAGKPVGTLTKSNIMKCPKKMTLNGLNSEGKPHSNTFNDYLKELAFKWNSSLEGSKVGTARIEFVPSFDGINDEMKNTHPFNVEKTTGTELKTSGQATTKMAELEIPDSATIDEAVVKLWHHGFAPKNETGEQVSDQDSKISTTFLKYEGGTSFIDVRLLKATKTDKVSGMPFPICIGSDQVCKNAVFRANLSSINFGGLIKVVAASMTSKTDSSMSDAASVQGQATSTSEAAPGTRKVSEKFQLSENANNLPYHPGFVPGFNPTFDGWSVLKEILNNNKFPDFTIDIDMPYSFGFTPKPYGGLLNPGTDTMANGTIRYDQGIKLDFYWYSDEMCEIMTKVEEISTEYRVTKVVHTIGLSGNSTQIGLCHLNDHSV